MYPLELRLSMRDTLIDNTRISADTLCPCMETGEGVMALVP